MTLTTLDTRFYAEKFIEYVFCDFFLGFFFQNSSLFFNFRKYVSSVAVAAHMLQINSLKTEKLRFSHIIDNGTIAEKQNV